MHPDVIIAGLRQELEGLDRNAADHKDRKKAIEAEIADHDGRERPAAATAEQPDVMDRDVGYLAGLRQELEQAVDDRKAEIKAEIGRVEKLIRDKQAETPEPGTTEPTAEPEPTVTDAPEMGDLDAKSRRDLNEIAAGHGIESPEKHPDKDTLVQAIRDKQAEPAA